MSRQYFEAESHVSTYNKFRPCPPIEMIEEIVRFTSEKVGVLFTIFFRVEAEDIIRFRVS